MKAFRFYDFSVLLLFLLLRIDIATMCSFRGFKRVKLKWRNHNTGRKGKEGKVRVVDRERVRKKEKKGK